MKIIKICISVLISVLTFYISMKYLEIKNYEQIFDIIFTYLSITIGFMITSITIIASSSYSIILYKKQDPKDNSKTLLHVIIGKFKTTIIFFIFPMAMIIVHSVIPWENINMIVTNFYDTIIFLLTLWTFPILVIQLKLILGFIIQSISVNI